VCLLTYRECVKIHTCKDCAFGTESTPSGDFTMYKCSKPNNKAGYDKTCCWVSKTTTIIIK